LKKLTNFTKNMKMKKTLYALSFLSILLYACKDEDVINSPDSVSTQATKDHLFAEQTFNDVGRIVREGFVANGQNKACPNYTLMNVNPSDIDTLIINFGTINCFSNGKLRNGKIIVTYTGKYRDSLAVITATFDDYHANNNLIQGERIVTNQGKDIVSKNMCFSVEVNNASVGTDNGTINWNATQTREWVSGNTTYYDISDDQYKITGTASGNAANGNAFTMEITETLNVDLGCLPSCVIKSGEAKITPNGYADRIINYGDSLCDCNFNVTINGNTYPIVVP
jgi:hypothetical protein